MTLTKPLGMGWLNLFGHHWQTHQDKDLRKKEHLEASRGIVEEEKILLSIVEKELRVTANVTSA